MERAFGVSSLDPLFQRRSVSPSVNDVANTKVDNITSDPTTELKRPSKVLTMKARTCGIHGLAITKLRASGSRLMIQEHGRERILCVDGRLIELEKAGWVEVQAMDHYTEGVLDLINMEWEGSELSLGEEQTLIKTGSISYPMDFVPDDEPKIWQPPIDEVR